MKKLLLHILLLSTFGFQWANAQVRRTDNSASRANTSPSASAFRNNSTSSLAPAGTYQQQNIPSNTDWRSMDMDERRQVVSNMSPRERSAFLQNMKANIVVNDINVPADKQDTFKRLYTDYQNSQKQIKEKFHPDKNIDQLSDQDALLKLNQSFDVGQQLLDNRKAFSDQFLKILTPQQVLKIFQTEGKMRDKMLDKKNDK